MKRLGMWLAVFAVATALVVPAGAVARTVIGQAVTVAINKGACEVLHKLVRREGLRRTERLFVAEYEGQGYSRAFSERFIHLLVERCG